MIAFLITTLLLAVVGVSAVLVFQRREHRRFQSETDSIVLRYLKVADNYESLMRDITEPYGGVLSALEDIRVLSDCFTAHTATDNPATGLQALERIEYQLRIIFRHVADRYRLTTEEKKRWLNNGREGQ